MKKGNKISRRTLLRASGVALALPYLEVMPAYGAAQTRRMVNICCTLGLYTPSWLPQQDGADYQATEYLKLIDQHRSRYTVFSGLSHEAQNGRQAHNSEITWLTSARHPGLDGFQNTISMDQAAANHIGYETRFPSIVLGTTSPQSQSYTANGVMVPAESSPAGVFKKLFLRGSAEEIRRETQSLNDGGSILDHLLEEGRRLDKQVSASDKHKLNAHFEAVRAAENQLTEVQAWTNRPKPEVGQESPVDIPDNTDLIGRIELMLNLIPLILQTDSSRVVSLMIQDHGVVPQIAGISKDQHGLSHHGQDATNIAQLKIIETEIIKRFGNLLTELQQPSLAGGSILDETAVLFGSNLGNAASHSSKQLPILVAGGGFAHGKHIANKQEQDAPLSDLFATLLQSMGLEVDAFGQGSKALHWS
ncbi:MAG: hypothetical protein CNF02_09235 [OM182 bacterium MED-G28]|uniref:DUF1552 domain-containing protein n=1 Tax=OM182 bacterium MED-G28 TaxID=1986256 RepID=A0A2A5WA64_9GAMM|nr:MAG: hypothetical protein CNF02_09235 [OM182 bacterium MED-G28]